MISLTNFFSIFFFYSFFGRILSRNLKFSKWTGKFRSKVWCFWNWLEPYAGVHCYILTMILALFFKIFSIQFFGGKFDPKICCSSNWPWIHFHLLIFILIFIFSLCIVSLPQADNHKHTFKLFRWKCLYWNHTSSWVFPWNFAAYFQNTFGGLLPNARLCCLKLSVFGTVFNPLVPGVNLKVTHT